MKKPSPRVQAKREARINQILEVASNAFNNFGYDATSVHKLSKSIGLTTTGLYHYVSNKETLLFQCYSRTVDMIERSFDKHEASHQGSDVVFGVMSDFYEVWRQIAQRQHPTLTIISEVSELSTEHRQQLTKRLSDIHQRLSESVKKAVEERDFRDVDPTTTAMLIFAITSWAPLWLGMAARAKTISTAHQQTLETLQFGLVDAEQDRHQLPKADIEEISILDNLLESTATVERILRRATYTFNRISFTHTSLEQLAISIGLSKSAIYHYFVTKTDLLLECYRRSTAIKQNILSHALSTQDSPLKSLKLLTQALLEVERANPGGLLSSRHCVHLEAVDHQQILEQMHSDRDKFTQVIQSGIEQGVFRQSDAAAVANIICGAIEFGPNLLMFSTSESYLKSLETFFDIALYGLKAPR